MSVRLPMLAISCGIALFALAGCSTEPVAAGSAPASTAPTTAATASAEPSATTETSATTEATEATEATKATRATEATEAGSCPVSAATLQKALRTPEGWRIDDTSLQCAQGWAQAGLIAPTPEKQGDGVVLFRFDTSGGRWVEVEQGSSIDCAARGIPAAAAGKLSVCNRPY